MEGGFWFPAILKLWSIMLCTALFSKKNNVMTYWKKDQKWFFIDFVRISRYTATYLGNLFCVWCILLLTVKRELGHLRSIQTVNKTLFHAHAFESTNIFYMQILDHNGHMYPAMERHCHLSMMSNCCTSVNPAVFPLSSRFLWACSHLWLETFSFLCMGPHNCGWNVKTGRNEPVGSSISEPDQLGQNRNCNPAGCRYLKSPLTLLLLMSVLEATADDVTREMLVVPFLIIPSMKLICITLVMFYLARRYFGSFLELFSLSLKYLLHPFCY